MSKETAIEWLMKKMPIEILLECHEEFYKAIIMEREQMIDGYSNGWHDGQDVILQQCKHIDKGGDNAGQQYYNETYKGGEQ